MRALACSFVLLGLGAALFAAPVRADDQEQKPEQSAAQGDKHKVDDQEQKSEQSAAHDDEHKVDDLWARLPLHIHSVRDIHEAHAHFANNSAAVIPQYTLHSSFGYVSYSGPFPVQSETHTAVAFTVHDATRGQLSVEFDRDTELGLLDRSAGAAFRVPLTPMLSLTGAAKFSADGAVNPVDQFSLAPSYTLFFVPQGQMFGALSVSVQGSHYRTADAFTVNPMFSFGSLASGVTFSVAYTFGNLDNAQPTATFLSLGQATITTGPSLSFNWTVNPQFTLALSVLPKNETVTLFSTSTETSARASASYKFSQGPRLGFAVQYMDTSAPLFGFLNRSLNVETSLTVNF